MAFNRNGVLSIAQVQLAHKVAELIGEEFRAALAEDRDIRNRSNIHGYIRVDEQKDT